MPQKCHLCHHYYHPGSLVFYWLSGDLKNNVRGPLRTQKFFDIDFNPLFSNKKWSRHKKYVNKIYRTFDCPLNSLRPIFNFLKLIKFSLIEINFLVF
jgi:hypothetical protein